MKQEKTASPSPLVSVVVVNWNGGRYLPKLLDSLSRQDYDPLEIIVVDNASTDTSCEIVEQSWPAVKLVRSSVNLGFAGGNNLGIARADGELLLLLNNDTWCDPDLVSRLVRFREERDIDVVAPFEGSYEGVTRQPYATTVDVFGHPVYLEARSGRNSLYLAGMCLLLGRELYEETGGLHEGFFMYFEEIDWFLRLRLLGKTFAYCPDIYVWHAGFGTSVREGRRAILGRDQFLWRNRNALQMLLRVFGCRSLCWILPGYLAINIAECLVFLLLGHWKIAWTYPQGWSYCVRNWRAISEGRRRIQRERLMKDRAILADCYHGVGKVRHLRGAAWRLLPTNLATRRTRTSVEAGRRRQEVSVP